MELAIDEFIIDWHLSTNDEERQAAESMIRLVKTKCHRLVFDYAYMSRFAKKLSNLERARKEDTYLTQVLVKRLRNLMFDSSKVRTCDGPQVAELESIEDEFDRLVAKSALCIQSENKLLITTDSDLIKKATVLKKYRVEILTPERAEQLLTSSSGSSMVLDGSLGSPTN